MRRSVHVGLIVATTVTAPLAARAQASPEGYLSGVAYSPGLAWLEKVRITLQRDSTSPAVIVRTDKTGRADLGTFAPGTYRLTAQMVGFTIFNAAVTVRAGVRDTVCIPMGKPPIVLVTCSTTAKVCGPSPVYNDTTRVKPQGFSCTWLGGP